MLRYAHTNIVAKDYRKLVEFYKEDNIVKLGRVLTLIHGNGIAKDLLEQSLIINSGLQNWKNWDLQDKKYNLCRFSYAANCI